MGWSIGYDSNWHRDIGYGVPAYCDHPKCKEEIDRGLSYVCGSEPYGGDVGCGLYFCEKHHCHYRDVDDDNDEAHGLCERCAKGRQPFKPKPEHPEWLHHQLTDESWAEWRNTKHIIMVTQGQGGDPVAAYDTLTEACTHARSLFGQMSVGIVLPGGKWYEWSAKDKKAAARAAFAPPERPAKKR